jgi:hypothetical protein
MTRRIIAFNHGMYADSITLGHSLFRYSRIPQGVHGHKVQWPQVRAPAGPMINSVHCPQDGGLNFGNPPWRMTPHGACLSHPRPIPGHRLAFAGQHLRNGGGGEDLELKV